MSIILVNFNIVYYFFNNMYQCLERVNDPSLVINLINITTKLVNIARNKLIKFNNLNLSKGIVDDKNITFLLSVWEEQKIEAAHYIRYCNIWKQNELSLREIQNIQILESVSIDLHYLSIEIIRKLKDILASSAST